MNVKDKPTELSYYGLYLLNYLKESHPDKAEDAGFVAQRADDAAGVYEQSRREGYPPEGAHELAMASLLKDLHFSKYDTLRDVLATEFEGEISEADIPAAVDKLLPLLDNVFSIYSLTDEFAQSSGYDLLYTELTGVVALYLEEYGI
ncbi:DUF1896 family protein [Bacteroides oleiciplenus]|uniref:DUF1896 domain-containing protein n=1 Tax=Bacteroides oleiciplenus YIT 12058 TaxID=742727 RepID=K9DUX9_9BACE|nr:DUF1896 family protein [Bacteroides oleiciplenus]EKU88729.1 hypothetical protein HMPREF9447_04047 [Bacteroides oleiciplenus YIT 12058]